VLLELKYPPVSFAFIITSVCCRQSDRESRRFNLAGRSTNGISGQLQERVEAKHEAIAILETYTRQLDVNADAVPKITVSLHLSRINGVAFFL